MQSVVYLFRDFLIYVCISLVRYVVISLFVSLLMSFVLYVFRYFFIS